MIHENFLFIILASRTVLGSLVLVLVADCLLSIEAYLFAVRDINSCSILSIIL